MRRLVLSAAVFLACANPRAIAQETTGKTPIPPSMQGLVLDPDTVAFSYKLPGLPVQEWGIEIHRDGKGRYWEAAPATEDNPDGKTWRDIEVGEGTRRRILAGYAAVNARRCETKAKHVASSGRKELTYILGPLLVSCVFNFSDDQGVTDAMEAFEAVAETIQIGAQLDWKHRYDRLGLDELMTSLLDEIKEGRAIELVNIAPALRRLADDPEVLQRVRSRAITLLAGIPGYALPVSNAR